MGQPAFFNGSVDYWCTLLYSLKPNRCSTYIAPNLRKVIVVQFVTRTLERAWRRLAEPRDNDIDCSYFMAAELIACNRNLLPGPVFIRFNPKKFEERPYENILKNSEPLCSCGRRLIIPTQGRYWLSNNPRRVVVGDGPGQIQRLIIGPHGGDITSAYFTISIDSACDSLFGTLSPYLIPKPRGHRPSPAPSFMQSQGSSYEMQMPLPVAQQLLAREGSMLAREWFAGDVRFTLCSLEKVDLADKTATFLIDEAVQVFNSTPDTARFHFCDHTLAA